jgi:hypothetical protein
MTPDRASTHPLNSSSYAREFFFYTFVAAIQVIDPLDRGCAARNEAADYEAR